MFFKHFAIKNQLPGLSITETLVENGFTGKIQFPSNLLFLIIRTFDLRISRHVRWQLKSYRWDATILFSFYSANHFMFFMSGVLLDLAPFPRFKKRKKRPWKSDTFNNVVGFSLTLLHFFNWDSLHTRLNSHYKARSYKKKKHKKIKTHRKSLYKKPTVNRCLLIIDLKPLRS